LTTRPTSGQPPRSTIRISSTSSSTPTAIYAPGDRAYEDIEQQLAAQPRIPVPTIVLHGEGDGVTGPEGSANDARFFTGPYQRRLIPIVGHDTPQEAPAAVTAAVLDLIRA
jgi:pimeloyl-ACP methyl ester carboxylesterase